MKSIRVPGKVMLTGEYAVLQGGTAVLTVVPRYLTVSESAAPVPYSRTPVIEAALRLTIDETVRYEQEYGLPNLTFDSSEFLHEDRSGNAMKLGLGSSAAEAVGVVALRFERAGLVWSMHRERITEHAMRAHFEVQGGKGSGADVAACAYGEPVKFRREETAYSVEPTRRSAETVPLHLVWTGHSADTRAMIEGFDSWMQRHGRLAANLVSELVESSNDAADAWFTSSRDMLYDRIDRFCSALQACTEAAGLPHKLPIHCELEDWAKGNGGRAKPTGAGGGDMILLIGDLPVDELDTMVVPIWL